MIYPIDLFMNPSLLATTQASLCNILSHVGVAM